MCESSTSFPASADSASASSEPECELSPSARSTRTVRQSSASTGPASPSTATLELFPVSDVMSSPGASPVSPGHMPGSSWARRMTAISGRRCLKSSDASGPLGLLERTLLDSITWGSTRCFLTWRMRGTPGGRSTYRLALSEPIIKDTDSGSWLATATATANQLCPSMLKHRGCRAMWPTPAARDYRSEKRSLKGLVDRIADSRGYTLPTQVMISEGLPSGSLNPEWVEWLMGYPAGWTALEPSEMPSSPRLSKRSVARS